jgi:flagellar motility protein MotE (MotC chaperone)
VTKKISDSLASQKKQYLDYVKLNSKGKTENTSSKTGFTEQDQKGYVKIYESMTPENAAKQLEQMSDLEAVKILLNIDSKQGAKILDKMDTKKAAKIWNVLNLKGTK